MPTTEQIRAAFAVFDDDNSGKLEVGELRSLLMRGNSKLTPLAVAEIIKRADKNGDGVVDIEEFIHMWSCSSTAKIMVSALSTPRHDPMVLPDACVNAVLSGDRESEAKVLMWLDAHGGHIDARDADTKSTLLMFACEEGDEAMAAVLLHRGANPNLLNCAGVSALMLAAAASNLGEVILLLLSGADTELVGAHGCTALQVAEQQESVEHDAVVFAIKDHHDHLVQLETPRKKAAAHEHVDVRVDTHLSGDALLLSKMKRTKEVCMEKARKGKYAHIKSKVDAHQDKEVMELTKAMCEVKAPRLEKGGKSKSGASHADDHSHEHGHEHGSKEHGHGHAHGHGDGGKSPRNSKDH